MIRLLAEAWMGLKAVTRVAGFREDWDQALNLTASGFVRSFFAAAIGIPVFWYTMQAALRLAGDLDVGDLAPITWGEFLVGQLRIWLLFPILAAMLTRLANVKHRFVPWVVLHNWATLFLILFQGLIFTLYLAGIANASVAATFYASGYLFFRLYLHARVAIAALGLPFGQGLLLGMIPVMADYVLVILIGQLTGSAAQ
jgi:hypothetical protein